MSERPEWAVVTRQDIDECMRCDGKIVPEVQAVVDRVLARAKRPVVTEEMSGRRGDCLAISPRALQPGERKMNWIPTAERLPTADDLRVKRPYWQRFGGYIEGMVVITVKSKNSTLREVHFAMCVVPPPWSDGTKPKPWFETPEGKSFDESRCGLIITAWSPVDVPGPYQDGDE